MPGGFQDRTIVGGNGEAEMNQDREDDLAMAGLGCVVLLLVLGLLAVFFKLVWWVLVNL